MPRIDNLMFGSGLGTVGHKASIYFENIITDGNYIKIFFEVGLVGFSLFLLIIVNTLVYVYRQFRIIRFEFLIIFVIFFQGLGNNVYSTYTIGVIFWLLIGIISNYYIKELT